MATYGTLATDGLGERIREVRFSLGLNQRAFARRLGVSYAAVSIWEQDRQTPKIDHLSKIAEAGGVTLEWLRKGGSMQWI